MQVYQMWYHSGKDLHTPQIVLYFSYIRLQYYLKDHRITYWSSVEHSAPQENQKVQEVQVHSKICLISQTNFLNNYTFHRL